MVVFRTLSEQKKPPMTCLRALYRQMFFLCVCVCVCVDSKMPSSTGFSNRPVRTDKRRTGGEGGRGGE